MSSTERRWLRRVDVRLAWLVGGTAALLNAVLVAGFALFAIDEQLEQEVAQIARPRPDESAPHAGSGRRWTDDGLWTALAAGPEDVLVHQAEGGEATLPLARFAVERGELVSLAAGIAVAGTLASIGFGVFAARRALRPVRDMRFAVRAIDPSHLAARVPNRESGDDVDALAAAINEVLARLEWAFARLAAFSADAAHELRTPLNRVLNESQLALLDDSSEGRTAALERIHESAERMAGLVNRLLLLANGEEGRLQPVRERVDVGALAAKLVEFYRPVAESAGQRIELERAAATSHCDRGLVEQALANLLENALLHAAQGAEIRVVVATDAAAARIGVLDSGPGIAAADRDRVFDRFVRLDGARSGPGSGLGLPIARMIARLHGGDLAVAPSPLGGAAFWMSLPDQPIGA